MEQFHLAERLRENDGAQGGVGRQKKRVLPPGVEPPVSIRNHRLFIADDSNECASMLIGGAGRSRFRVGEFFGWPRRAVGLH
jgi:hypothetical protein